MLSTKLDLLNPQTRGQLLTNESLSKYTSWKVGGLADYLFIPEDIDDLSDFLRILPHETPLTWLGLGSNTLVRDGGIEGVVIVTQGALNKVDQLVDGTIRAEAGMACGQLARYTARLGLTGLEFMAGIPGTVGGALAMNAGCYGGETWQNVAAVETINREGEKNLRQPQEFAVGYRHARGPKDEWFVAGHFALQPGDKTHSLATIKELLDKRNAAQPTHLPNGGSVFRNPPGNHAGRLIEQCGLKGFAIGKARVSEKHANFIVNEGNAKAADIEALIHHVAKTVEEKHGVSLVPEVLIIGKNK